MPDINCDVLIVGSGVGGLTATIAAKLCGMKPLLLEKQDRIGGSSALSGGVLWLPNNPIMQRLGIEDSREAALTYLANFVGDDDPGSTPERREAYVDAVDALVMLYESQGVPLRYCDGYSDYFDLLPGGHPRGRSLECPVYDLNKLGAWKDRFQGQNFPVPASSSESGKLATMAVTWAGRMKALQVVGRAAVGKVTGKSLGSAGASLQGRLLKVALDLGCDIRTNAPFVDLEKEGGRVTGATAQIDGEDVTIAARRGVLITAGGFARNTAMRRQYQKSPISTDWTHSNKGETGEAIQAMATAGAALGWMDQAWWTPGFRNPDEEVGSNQIIPELHKPHVILVGADGKRFVNEAENYMALGRACYERNDVTQAIPAWAIMDASHRKRYTFGYAMPGKVPKDWIERGMVKVADTVEELAQKCGIDPEGLARTIARWNAMNEAGHDEDFGKGASAYNRYYADPTNKPNPCMGPIVKPPFWAAPLYVGDVGTCGGAVTNEHAQVKRPDGTIIEGLYAAGNCASPIAGAHYIGAGHSLGCSAVFGMLAVRHMSEAA